MNLTNPYDGERRPGTVGLAVPRPGGADRRRATRQPIADERAGEIQVRGPNVFPGYWQRPGGDRRGVRRADGLVQHRRPRPALGRRLLHDLGPRARADHLRRLQRLPARGRGGAADPPRRRRGGGDRPAAPGLRRAGRRRGRGQAGAARRSRRTRWSTSAGTSWPATRSRASVFFVEACRATRSARCRSTCCGSSSCASPGGAS